MEKVALEPVRSVCGLGPVETTTAVSDEQAALNPL
jgi:hypothetical protein